MSCTPQAGSFKAFTEGMDIWAAQGDSATIDALRLARLAWAEYFLIVVLVLAGLAALARAPWTVFLQLLVAATAFVFLVLSQHEEDKSHPEPAPTPSAGYTPCYSGSGGAIDPPPCHPAPRRAGRRSRVGPLPPAGRRVTAALSPGAPRSRGEGVGVPHAPTRRSWEGRAHMSRSTAVPTT